jgi:hypothetical protein
MALRRRMTVVRLASGQLVIHSCMPLAEPAMRELEAWGEPAYLVVPSRFHRLDAPAYKARYPSAKVLCGEAAHTQVAKVVAVDGAFADLPVAHELRAEPVRGTDGGEHVFFIGSGAGRVSLLMNDVVFNHPHASGFGGFILRFVGSSGPARVTRIARTFLITDRAALRTHLLALADTPGLVRVIVSHVDVIDHEPAITLRRLAGTL